MKTINLEGITKYAIALLDIEIAAENVKNGEEECVFTCQHEGVYSAGRSALDSDFKASMASYKVYYTNRGGRVTAHFPGQIVVYPIINLKMRNISLGEYVWMLEDWMIKALAEYGLEAYRTDLGRGVWIQGGKIGFVGIRVSSGVATHGFCLNITDDIEQFRGIIPCGLDSPIASMMKPEHCIAPITFSLIKLNPFA
jgi:lipoyl(octanoyl) transferase